jgi:hypothetical protein
VVDLLAEKDDVLTKAAQRLIRLFPSNRFYKPLQAYWQKTTMSDEELSQMAEAAVYYYFNRIVEYQGSFPLDEQSRGWVQGNYDNGQAWVDRAAAKDNSNRLLGAMLDYARGAVLWDRKEEEAGMYFRRMLDVIRTSDESYPFNPQHIATALAVVNDPGQVTKVPASSRPYNAGERRKLSAKVFQSEAGQIKLYALPHIQSKELAKVGADASARMILHAEGWDLLRVGAQLGWAQRTAPTIATADAVH